MRGLEAIDLGEGTRDVGAHGVGHVVGLERLRDGLRRDLRVQADDVIGVDLLLLVLGVGFLLSHVFLLMLPGGEVVILMRSGPRNGSRQPLLQVQLVEILLAVLGDMALAARFVVAQQ